MKTKVSQFPGKIDGRSYFSNVSLMNQGMLSEHHNLMSAKRYQEASSRLHESGIDYYSAELFNYLEDCVYKIGQILQHKVSTPSRPIYSPTPGDVELNSIWISNTEIEE